MSRDLKKPKKEKPMNTLKQPLTIPLWAALAIIFLVTPLFTITTYYAISCHNALTSTRQAFREVFTLDDSHVNRAKFWNNACLIID